MRLGLGNRLSDSGRGMSADDRVDQRARGRGGGDPGAWVEAHGDALFRFAMLRLRDRDEAEEAVQECFVAALGARQTFAERSSERTWLIGILKHKVVDRIRARHARTDRVAASEESAFFDHRGLWKVGPKRWKGDPSSAMQRKEFRRVLSGCLATLPAGLVDAFALRELDRMETDELCAVLQITAANLWQRLHRARLTLRRCLELNWFRPPNKRGPAQ